MLMKKEKVIGLRNSLLAKKKLRITNKMMKKGKKSRIEFAQSLGQEVKITKPQMKQL